MTTVLSAGLDTRDMRLIHRVFHREFGRLPGLVRAAAGPQAQTRRWNALADHGFATILRRRRLVILGYILDEAAADERTRFLRQVPRPARLAFALFGQRQHRRETQALRSR
jgi:hypothetical protein